MRGVLAAAALCLLVSTAPVRAFSLFDTTPPIVAEARKFIGTNPTHMARLWCARFMNFVLARLGQKGTGSDLAFSFLHFGKRSSCTPGAIAVLRRHGGGHVGVVSGLDARGNPILVSGNDGRRVRERVHPRARVVACVRK